MDILDLLIWPFIACLVLTGIHCYMGIHVVGRGVIFVDLAMAQIAFLGSATALFALGWMGSQAEVGGPPGLTYEVAANDAGAMSNEAAHVAARLDAMQSLVFDEAITDDLVDGLLPPDTTTGAPPALSESASAYDPPIELTVLSTSVRGTAMYAGGILFTLVGAALFSLGRLRDRHIPQEAVIGIIYAVSTALALVLLYEAPNDVAEQTKDMLVGRILFVDSSMVIKTAILYAVIGVIHYLLRKPFLAISFSPDEARASGMSVRFWDFVFYATFGVIVTSSVQMAGILLVFSFLIVPSVCAMLFFKKISHRLCFGWAIGLLASVLGIALSVYVDIPTGASIVITFGGILILLVAVRAVFQPRLA